ncbi:MAG: ribokinase [Herpetosiphonaceae bacterium]|nr:MAG: ribokinase [Herpetosiphonaceae bacterium]
MAEIICYGSIAIDELLWLPRWPVPGDDLHPQAEAICLGGPALNVALPLSTWGHSVAVGGNCIGDDQYGRMIVERLTRLDLDWTALAVEPGRRTTICTLLITPSGERTIIGRAFMEAAAGPLPSLEGARYLSLDLYGPGRRDAAQQAKAAGLNVIAGDIASTDDPLVHLCDVIVLSADVLRAQQPERNPLDYAASLQAAGARLVALTDGPRPATLLADNRMLKAQPPQLPIHDTTGAGDSFRAGLIHGLLSGWELERILAFAVAAGALRCTRAGGAEEPPPLVEVEALAMTVETWD